MAQIRKYFHLHFTKNFIVSFKLVTLPLDFHIPFGALVFEWTLLHGSQLESGPCGL